MWDLYGMTVSMGTWQCWSGRSSCLTGSSFFFQVFPRGLMLHSLPRETWHLLTPCSARINRENAGTGTGHGITLSHQCRTGASLSQAGLEWDISAIPTWCGSPFGLLWGTEHHHSGVSWEPNP